MLKKKPNKKFIYQENIEKNIKFLKGPYCKIQTPIQWNICRKPGKKTIFKIKQKILS